MVLHASYVVPRSRAATDARIGQSKSGAQDPHEERLDVLNACVYDCRALFADRGWAALGPAHRAWAFSVYWIPSLFLGPIL